MDTNSNHSELVSEEPKRVPFFGDHDLPRNRAEREELAEYNQMLWEIEQEYT